MKKILIFIASAIVTFNVNSQVANDICADAIDLGSLPNPAGCPSGAGSLFTYNGTTTNAVAENPYASLACMDAPAADVWVSFVASGNEMDLDFTSGLGDANIGIYTGSCGALVGLFCEASNNGNISVNLQPFTPGETYYMQISGQNATDFDDFTLEMTNYTNCAACVLAAGLTATPAPTNGYYLPGTTVQFCLNISEYEQVSTNWIHGILPTFGAGWDLSTLTPVSAPNAAGAYGWIWVDPPGGDPLGWWVDNDPNGPGLGDGDPTNNFGDNGVSGNGNWTWCWEITTDASCTPGADLGISVNTTADGETGSWTSAACQGDGDVPFIAAMICCDVPLITSIGESCPGANDGSATALGQGGVSPYDYEWEFGGSTIYTDNNNAGVSSLGGLAAGTYTVTVTDDNGCVQIIDIIVLAAAGCPIPVFDPEPADAAYQCAPPAMTNLTWNDPCYGTGLVAGVDASDGNTCPETITRTWSYTNPCGNTVIATQIITVDDTQVPVMNAAPANTSVQCSGDVPAMIDLGWTDNCDGAGFVTGADASDGNNCPEIITRTWTYTDVCGNVSVAAIQIITVDDTQIPVMDAEPANIAVQCLVDVPAMIDLGWTDNCDGAGVVTGTDASDGNTCPEIITRTWIYTDICGNASVAAVQTITIMVTTGPVVPANASSTVNCLVLATQPAAPIVTDQCGNNLVAVVTENTDPVCEGDKIYTFTYTDCASNVSVYTYTYTIDILPFTLPVDDGSVVNCPVDAQVAPTPPVMTDMCGTAIVPTVVVPPLGGCTGAGIDWVYTYTDCAGNTADWIYTYTINLPPFVLPADDALTVDCLVDAQVAPTPPVMVDLCGTAIVPVMATPADIACEGTMTYVFTYTDCAGNTADWTYVYTIDYPIFTVPADGSEAVVCITDVVVPTPPAGIIDACGAAVIPVMTENADPVCVGDKIYTFTYTDCAGNIAIWTYTISINDNVNPTGTAPADISLPGGTAPVCDPNLVTGVSDNCSVPVVTCLPDVSDGGTCPEIITRTYHIEDACGNFIEVVQLITIGDAIMPTASNPADINIECLADVPPFDVTVVTDENDNGATPIVTWEDDTAGGGVCPDTLLRRYRVTDDCGNFIFVTQNIIMEPITAPVVPADGLSTVDCLVDAQVVPTPPAVTDVCGNPLVPVMATPADIVCEGDMAYVFTYTDCAGNATDWTYTYTVDLPTFTLPVDDASTVNCLVDAQVAPTPPVMTDMCGNAIVPVMVTPADIPCEGDMVYTFTYTDCAGNTADWLYTYTIDILPFTLPANDALTVDCLVDAQVAPTAPVMTDMCGTAMVPVMVAPADIPCEGDMVYTFTYTDCAGNTADWVYTYTIDILPFTLPANDALTVNCLVDAQVVPTAPVMTDMCGTAMVPVMVTPADIPCEGDMVYTFTYTDCAGNTADWTYTYTIDIPAFTIPYVNTTSVVNCVIDAQVQPADPGVVADMCGNVLTPVITAPSPTGCTGVGAVWIFTYTDCAGNTADWTHTYTITLAPFVIPFADDASTVNCLVDAQVEPIPPGVVNDACGNAIVPVVTTPADIPCEGTMTYVFTYTDCAGNTADWTYVYTIDILPFTLPVDDALTVNCLVDAQVAPTPPVMTDMCGTAMVPVMVTPADIPCEGDMVYTFTYTDCAGNTADWLYTYTIDILPFTLPANDALTVNCLVDAQVAPTAPVMTDMCGTAMVPVMVTPADIPCEGDMVYTFTYTDCAGNTADWLYTYTIDILPFTLPANDALTVNCLVDAQVAPTAPVMTDMCGTAMVPVMVTPADIPCEGDMVYTFTYTDCAGNTADWLYTYTIDILPFTLPANDALTVNCLVDAQVAPTPPVMTDMCGAAMVPVMATPADIPCEGDMVYTFTYTDCAGNTADWLYTYTIDIPAFTIPYVNTTSVVNCVIDAQVQPADPGVVVDMCGNVLTPVITAPSPTGCTGVGAVWIFTYTDCAGNTADWTHTYTITLAPFVIPFADDASTVNCLVDAQVEPIPPGVVNDACGNAIVPVVTTPADIACEGTMTYVFTYTDCAGNTADWTYVYTIDILPFTLPVDDALTVNCLVDAQVAPTPPVMTDMCGTAMVPVMVAPADIPCEGDMVYTFTYTDCAGNTADWLYTYTIDILPFTLPVDDALTVNCLVDAQVAPTAPVMTDMCGTAMVPVMVTPADIPCEGDMVYTFTYTDCAGNTADWLYTYTIDILPFTLPANDALTVNCLVDAQVAPTPPVMTDMCGTAMVPVMVTPADIPCEGDMVYTFTYTDCAGNTADWLYTYTIDILPFTLPANDALTVNCLVDAQVAPTPPVMTDMCGTAMVPVMVTPADIPCEGDMVYTFTYTDCAGNTADWLYTYTIDILPFTLPVDDGSVVNCPVDAQVAPTPPVMTDMCGTAIIPTVVVPPAGGCTGVGVDWVFTYTDCAGNTADWTYTYSIVLPPFTLPVDDASTVNCLVDAQVEPIPPVMIDLCGNAIVPVVTTPADIPCEGTMTYVFTYTDCAGNTADWTYVYSIDILPFTLPVDGLSTVNCLVDAQVSPTPPVMTDMCGTAMVPVMVAPVDIPCEGDMVYTFTYTDCAGNTADWLYTYTIDILPFTLPVNDASTVDCLVDAQVAPTPPVMTDMCGTAMVPVMAAPADIPCEGDMVYTFTYTDCAGNTADWLYTYTIDILPFTLPVDDASTVNCLVDAQVAPIAPVMTDMCGTAMVPVMVAPADIPCEGDMVYTFTYTDCAGNTADWLYTYTIDILPFTLPANDALTVNCLVDAQVVPTAPVMTDMCGTAMVPVMVAPADIPCEGDMIYKFTYTDCAGNTADWLYTYTIDILPFTLPVNDASTVDCLVDAQVAPTPPVMTDMCGTAMVPVMVSPSGIACEGDMIYTFTYTDCAGNTADWLYTYTIDILPFTLPVDDASTVNCLVDAQVAPIPPVMTDMCGTAMVPVMVTPADIPCEGTMTYVFTYTDCAGNTADWTYVYTIDILPFTLPANDALTVNCLVDAQVTPTAPVMTDMCGTAMVPVMVTPADIPCEGDMVYVFTYTDCAGNTADWTYTYTIDTPTFTVPVDETEAVVCITDIYIPTPPAVNDICGNALVPVMTQSVDPVCVGDKVYTFTYTDCAGNVVDWLYTFSINDNINPTASNPISIQVPGSMDVPAPDVTVVFDELDNCTANPVVVWVSDVSDGNVCNLEVITRTYSVTDDCGNQILVTQEITILAVPAPIDAGPDQIICLDEFVTLTADNPWNVLISWDNNVVDGVAFSPIVTDIYTVTADNLGCISTDQVVVTVEEPPVVSFVGDILAGCEPLEVTFTNTSTTSGTLVDCLWEFSDGTSMTGCGNVTTVFENGGLYDVTLTTTSANGCSSSATYVDYVYVENVPVASFTPSQTELSNIFTEVSFDNTSIDATEYIWTFGDGSPSSTVFEPTHEYPFEEGGTYVIQLIAMSPLGCADTAYATITISEEVIFYVPNTFTPDGDNFNEYFQAIFTSGYDPYDFELLIFNRWGELIWESHDDTKGWDGTYGGNLVQDGTYTWKIEFKTTETDERRMVVGHVNVIR